MTRRYLLVKVITERPLTTEQLASALTNSVRKFFGEFGLTRIDPKIIRYDANRSEAIVACNKEGAEDFQAAIGLIPEAPEASINAITMRVSGTLKGLRRRQRF